MKVCLRFLIVCLALWFAVVQSQNVLREPPAFLKPCSVNNSQRDACLSELIKNILIQWKDGVPDLPSVGSLDPFRVRKLRIAQRVPPNLDVQVTLRNMTTHGLSQAKILNSTTVFNPDQYSLGFHVQLSKTTIKCNYRMRGHVLLLNLNSAGVLNSQIDNLEFYLALKMNPTIVNDTTFLNVSAVKTEIVNVDRIKVDLSNLFGGNRELESSANQLFNENWRVLFDILRPVLTQTFDSVILNRFSNIFKYVPARFFFENLP